MLIAASVFALVLTIIFGGYWTFVVLPEGKEERAVRARLKATRSKRFAVAMLKPEEPLSAVGPLNGALSLGGAAVRPLRRLVHQSGLQITLGTLVLTVVFFALAAMLLVAYLTSSIWLAVGGGGVAALSPLAYLRYAARKRVTALETQFPEAADLMARALRAGHAFTMALQMAADELPEPLGPEFRLLFEQQNYGMSLADALKEFAARVPLLDVRFFVTAVLTQRETGGNLAEVLDSLSAVIRDRFKVRRQIRVISAHGRTTGLVLGFLPPIVAIILFTIAPEHMKLLFDDPLGRGMLIGAVVLQAVGVLIIRRIVNVEY
jgi:tight adherence protein B